MSLRAISSLLSPSGWSLALRYLLVAAAANLVWEAAQLPLYTVWVTASRDDLANAVIHCTGGDAIILSLSLLLALLLTRTGAWPNHGYWRVTLMTTFLGASYAIVSEWLNTKILLNWAYAPAMPLVPPFGTGLSPLLQWLLIPPAVLMVIRPSRLDARTT